MGVGLGKWNLRFSPFRLSVATIDHSLPGALLSCFKSCSEKMTSMSTCISTWKNHQKKGRCSYSSMVLCESIVTPCAQGLCKMTRWHQGVLILSLPSRLNDLLQKNLSFSYSTKRATVFDSLVCCIPILVYRTGYSQLSWFSQQTLSVLLQVLSEQHFAMLTMCSKLLVKVCQLVCMTNFTPTCLFLLFLFKKGNYVLKVGLSGTNTSIFSPRDFDVYHALIDIKFCK